MKLKMDRPSETIWKNEEIYLKNILLQGKARLTIVKKKDTKKAFWTILTDRWHCIIKIHKKKSVIAAPPGFLYTAFTCFILVVSKNPGGAAITLFFLGFWWPMKMGLLMTSYQITNDSVFELPILVLEVDWGSIISFFFTIVTSTLPWEEIILEWR